MLEKPTLIERIEDDSFWHPRQKYFAKTASDGWALAHAARELLGVGKSFAEDVRPFIKGCGLGAPYSINGVAVPANAVYTYQLWAVAEYIKARYGNEASEERDYIIEQVRRIGCYPNGWWRYCSTETGYIVPNATSAAANLFAWAGDTHAAEKLMHVLAANQVCDNWRYQPGGHAEDSMHLALMIYQLTTMRDLDGSHIEPPTQMIYRALAGLVRLNRDELQPGSIGWAPPWVMLAMYGDFVGSDLFGQAHEATVGLLEHENFRTRAMAAFCLAKHWQLTHRGDE